MLQSPRLILSALGCLTLTAPAQTYIAFTVPAGQEGSQGNFGGALGMEFNVVSPVTVTRLGCFDDLSDGLKRDIQVRFYDRSAPDAPLATLDFIPDDPGTPAREDGELVGGSRFLTLTPALNLPAGFQGMIVASNYGAEERNGNKAAPRPWTMDGGGGLISFTDCRDLYGVDATLIANVADGGVNGYAAGTFEFKINGAAIPPAPAPVLTGGNGKIDLAWPAVTQPVPAERYRILRAASAAGPFTQIAEVTATTYSDSGLTNGSVYYYQMVSVAAGNVTSAPSTPLACAPYQLAAGRHISYFVPGNLVGNQEFGGSLGMDFDVQNPVKITRLGVYDSNSDGLKPDPGADGITGNEDDTPRLLSARLYDRDTQEILASADFTTEAPGTLIAGMRFLDLAAPITLPAGFHGTIVADGYGKGEPLRNSLNTPANAVWALDNGDNSLVFTGTGRYGDGPGGFPGTADASLPAAYAAGTFEYETTAAAAPGKPLARLAKAIDNAAVNLAWDAVTTPLAAATYRIYRYNDVDLTYTLVGQTADLTFRVTGLTNAEPVTLVVRGVSSGGTEGLSSDSVTATPAAPAAGVAYVVPEGTAGSQSNFSGSLGMDFDVANPVRVTRLGAFDSGADGLLRPITVAIYDRATGNAVTPLVVFPVDDAGTPAREDGEPVEGSRFLSLATPVVLPAGFQGSIVAYNYGAEEPNGNPNAGGWTTFSGGSLVFVGGGRWDTATGVLPANVDAGPANRYAAGTFQFEPAAVVPTFDANLIITRSTGNQVRIDWTATPGAVLQRSPDLKSGNWVNVPTAQPGYLTTITGREFFRLIKP